MIICGDALTELRNLDSDSVDAVVTDPPFGIGFVYGDGKEAHSTPGAYWSWLEPICIEMWRVARPGAFFAIWQTQLNFPHFWEWFGDLHIYAAVKNFVQLRPTPINYGYDPVVMFYKDGEPLRPEKPERSLDWSIGNTARFISETKALERQHPCPRPIDQVQTILENFVLPGGLVLDPFFGSGTTGIAAIATHRQFIGIELNPEYVQLAEKRLKEVQQVMF